MRVAEQSIAEPTILNEDGQALLDQERRVEDNQPEAQRQHVVTRPDLQEISDSLLHGTKRKPISSSCIE